MKNFEIRDRLEVLVREERRVGKELVELLALAMGNRAWLEFGYGSLFDWLTRGFGYSPAAAMRRIEAARLLGMVPEAESLSISVMAKVQGAIRSQEKVEPVSNEQRAVAVQAVAGLSAPQAEKRLVELFPASGEKARREVRREAVDGSVRHSLNLDAKASANLKCAKEVFSHKFPNASDAEIISFALEFLLEKKDPERRPAASLGPSWASPCGRRSAPCKWCFLHHFSAAEVKSNKGECTFIDSKTGVKCTSRYQIQVDHIKPRALGGGNESANLRTLCRQHNLYEAEQVFGKASISRFRRVNSTKP